MAAKARSGHHSATERMPVGCPARVHAMFIDGRYFRWRCTDRNCAAVQEAKRKGRWAFHLFDIITHEITDAEEDPHR